MLATEGAALEVELISAVEFAGHGEKAGERKPFCLTLRGPLKPLFPQKIYRLEHETLEPLEVFIVPVGPDKQGMQYEVQFT